jgi:hypothetical protein
MVNDQVQNSLLDRISEISVGIPEVISASVKLDPSVIRRGLPSEHEIPIISEALSRACDRWNTKINVYLDRIDQQLEEPLTGELFYRYAKYIGGACLASARIAGQVGRSGATSSPLRLYVFAREDLVDEVRPHLHNVSEFDGMTFRLKWRLETLMDLIGARLATALSTEYDPTWSFEIKQKRFFSDDLFHRVFERFKADGWSVWRFLLVHTHMRPRDVINFCNTCRVEAANAQKRQINDSALNLGTHEYSTMRYEELVASGRWMISNYQGLVDSFRRKPLIVSRRDLVSHLNERMTALRVQDVRLGVQSDASPDVDGMIRSLYRAGLIVAPREGDPSLPYLAHYVEPHLPTLDQAIWVIHPAFFREMQGGQSPANVRAILEQASGMQNEAQGR